MLIFNFCTRDYKFNLHFYLRFKNIRNNVFFICIGFPPYCLDFQAPTWWLITEIPKFTFFIVDIFKTIDILIYIVSLQSFHLLSIHFPKFHNIHFLSINFLILRNLILIICSTIFLLNLKKKINKSCIWVSFENCKTNKKFPLKNLHTSVDVE